MENKGNRYLKETIDLLKKPYTQNQIYLEQLVDFAQEEESMGLYHSDCCLYHTGLLNLGLY